VAGAPEASLLEGVPTPVEQEGGQRPLREYLDLDHAEKRRRSGTEARKRVFRWSLALADLVAVSAALFLGTVAFGDERLTLAAFAVLPLVIVVLKVVGLYDRDEHLLHKTTLDELPALFEVATLLTLLLWLGGDGIVDGDLGRRQVLGIWALLFVFLILGRSFARFLATKAAEPERCLVIGDAESVQVLRRKLELTGSTSAQIVGWIPAAEAKTGGPVAPISMLPTGLYRLLAEQQVHRVVVAPGKVDPDALLHLVRELSAMKVSVSVLPATPPVAGSSSELDHIHGLTLLGVRNFEIGRSSRIIKRTFDLVASTVLLVLLLPLLLAIAIAIKANSPGPVLFKQRRVGRHGEEFEIFKFRSMFDGADALRDELRGLNQADGLFKIENDPRITRVGRVLRQWSLDELPQLLNVLRGEMSLVGPRPLVPDEDSLVEGFYRRRLDLAPGITGYWQALGSARIPLFEMVRLDFLYVTTWSLWNDIRILMRTVPFVIGRRGW
jgi:exopolysaccharide biosynthesis polyprenyl glycosylphosphotransferase